MNQVELTKAQLRKELENYKSEKAIAKLYRALIKQMEDQAEIMQEHKLINFSGMDDKDDKMFDRAMKIMENAAKNADNLQKIERLVNPEILKREENSTESNLDELLLDD